MSLGDSGNTLKVIAEDEAKKEEEERELQHQNKKNIKQRKKEVENRSAFRKSIINHFAPGYTQEGVMSKVAYQSQLTPEGLAAVLMIDLLIFAVNLLLNTPYMAQQAEWRDAIEKEKESIAQGNPVKLAYMADEKTGLFPTVYYTDEETGEIDYAREYENGQAPRFAVRANGLAVVPEWTDGLISACNAYIASAHGSNTLNAAQKLQVYGVLENANNEMKRNNIMQDRQYLDMQRARPMPKPK